MPYEPANLSPTTTTSELWAIAWARKLAQDVRDTPVWDDPEWLAELGLDAFTDSTPETHYRPHLTAARVIETNVNYAISESVLGASWTKEKAGVVAGQIRQGYKASMDAALAAALPSADSMPVDTSLRLVATF